MLVKALMLLHAAGSVLSSFMLVKYLHATRVWSHFLNNIKSILADYANQNSSRDSAPATKAWRC